MFEAIPLETFQDRTGLGRSNLCLPWHEAGTVVSLRDIVEVLTVQFMPDYYLQQLLHSVTLEGDPSIHPYANCTVKTFTFEPDLVQVAQTFVERKKYQKILEGFSGVFSNIQSINGIAKLPAVVVLGITQQGTRAVAHYIPPIVEFNHVGRNLVDGTHRNFIIRQVGTLISGIMVEGVETPFPCQTLGWNDVQVVDEKPPREQRFIGLRPDLFRDLKYIGIDG